MATVVAAAMVAAPAVAAESPVRAARVAPDLAHSGPRWRPWAGPVGVVMWGSPGGTMGRLAGAGSEGTGGKTFGTYLTIRRLGANCRKLEPLRRMGWRRVRRLRRVR